ncbi:MAG TPA: DUF2281 domain-containing protein [Balneolaceae bacterium]|nr:DUF2281 domain-containing protein [Balneolaceae bacterium]
MSKPTISKKINELPPDAKKEAQDFVDFLYQRYVVSKEMKKSGPGKVSESSFFGIWKNREEMSDSVKWVKNIRKYQWRN